MWFFVAKKISFRDIVRHVHIILPYLTVVRRTQHRTAVLGHYPVGITNGII